MIVATFMEVVQLSTGAAVGFGVMQTLAANGVRLEDKSSRWQAIGILSVFSSIWIMATTLIIGYLQT